jgi:uncharacterized iron-regulated membrane protein
MSLNKRQQQAGTLRLFRKIHRITGASLFVFFFIVAVTGTLLGWKKHSNGVLLAQTQTGTTNDLSKWLPLDTLQQLAISYAHQHIDSNLSPNLDRIDVRNEKGIIKFVFADGFWGIQVDGASGKLLSIERRRSDFIEKIHDGSILDEVFNTSNGQIKLVYTSIMGLALCIFTITGFWLWYGPKRMRKN